MTNPHTPGSWNVGRATGICSACTAALPPNAVCWAALCDRAPQSSPLRGDIEAQQLKGNREKEPMPPSPFVRLDFCEKCWSSGTRPGNLPDGSALTMFSYWKTVVPTPQQKKKLLVDDSVLVDVFARMEGRSEPQEVRFRFVLALILMRKRLLKYDGMETPDSKLKTQDWEPATQDSVLSPQSSALGTPPEIWRMIPRGQENPVHVINPHLTAEQITEVSQQLSAILAEEI